MSGAKGVKGSIPRPEEATPPHISLLHSRWHQKVMTTAGLSWLPPRCPSPSSHCPEFPQQRLWPRPTTEAAAPRLSMLTPSPQPESELRGACLTMAQGLERAGTAGWGAKTELTYSNPTGNTIFHSLSAIFGGRHHATLRLSLSLSLSLFPPRRRHIRLWASRGNTGSSRTVEVQHLHGLNQLAQRDYTCQHAWAPLKKRASKMRDLRVRSQRPAYLPYSRHSGRPTVGVSRLARILGRGREELHRKASLLEPNCALHAGACSCLSSPSILPFFGAPRVGTAALCTGALGRGGIFELRLIILFS